MYLTTFSARSQERHAQICDKKTHHFLLLDIAYYLHLYITFCLKLQTTSQQPLAQMHTRSSDSQNILTDRFQIHIGADLDI